MDQYMITEQALEKLYKKNFKRMRQGKALSDQEIRITAAAGYALDVIETSKRANGHRLDLTMETMDNFPYVLTLCGMANQRAKELSKDDMIIDLIKKAASYEMFCLCSALNDGQFTTCEIVVPANESEPVLCAKDLQSGTKIIFNVYDAYRRAQRDNEIFIQVSADTMSVNSGLASNIIYEELLKPLGLDSNV